MSTYAIGDVQGCYIELCRLLKLIRFKIKRDRLWFVGDLVNTGPNSLEVLRLVYSLYLRHSADVVLGNHDLNLLATACGVRMLGHKDTFMDTLKARDSFELLEWLKHCPLIHRDNNLGYTMVHAGIPPQWSTEQATSFAAEACNILKANYCDGLASIFVNIKEKSPDRCSEASNMRERLGLVVNTFTRMRYVHKDGRIDTTLTGPPGSQHEGFLPWYEATGRLSKKDRIVFGHWASLREVHPIDRKYNVYPLDTGCVYGGYLTAMRLEDEKLFSVPGCRVTTQE